MEVGLAVTITVGMQIMCAYRLMVVTGLILIGTTQAAMAMALPELLRVVRIYLGRED